MFQRFANCKPLLIAIALKLLKQKINTALSPICFSVAKNIVSRRAYLENLVQLLYIKINDTWWNGENLYNPGV